MSVPAARVMQNIAKRRHISQEELRRQLNAVIAGELDSPNRAQQEQWAQIPHEGALPTAEDVLEYFLAQGGSWDAFAETQASLYLESLLEPNEG